MENCYYSEIYCYSINAIINIAVDLSFVKMHIYYIHIVGLRNEYYVCLYAWYREIV